jgi:hypothetical protein
MPETSTKPFQASRFDHSTTSKKLSLSVSQRNMNLAASLPQCTVSRTAPRRAHFDSATRTFLRSTFAVSKSLFGLRTEMHEMDA